MIDKTKMENKLILDIIKNIPQKINKKCQLLINQNNNNTKGLIKIQNRKGIAKGRNFSYYRINMINNQNSKIN